MSEAEEPDKSTLREYFEALLIAMIFVNFARIFVFQAFKIPTGSMIDNLLIGDHIIVNKFIYGPRTTDLLSGAFPLREVRRGDVVVFRYPEEPDTDFVKRVIALPGETLTMRDKRVFIDGRELEEPYVRHDDPQIFPGERALPSQYGRRDQFGPYEVPADAYFVMGDNRDRSNDSRFWGPVPRELIKGRAFLVYWSYRGMEAPAGSSPGERLRELAAVAANFFSDTRWERSFVIVDGQDPGMATERTE